MTDWLPIESAPKDGTTVLLWTDTDNDEDRDYVETIGDGEHIRMVQTGWYDGGWETLVIGQPTHWQPLPPPPASGTGS